MSDHICPTCGQARPLKNETREVEVFDGRVVSNTKELFIDGKPIELAKSQASIAHAIARAGSRTAHKDYIMNVYCECYGWPAEEPERKVIDVLVCRLRKRLKETKLSIETVFNVGYRFVLED